MPCTSFGFQKESRLINTKNIKWFTISDVCKRSTRVSNEVGAGNPQAARVAVSAVMFLAIIEAVAVSTTLFFCRHILGYAYSSDKEVADYIAAMTPLICLSIVMDSIQGVLSG